MFHFAKDPILVKLVFKALHSQNNLESDITLIFARKKDLSSFISVKETLKAVQLRLMLLLGINRNVYSPR